VDIEPNMTTAKKARVSSIIFPLLFLGLLPGGSTNTPEAEFLDVIENFYEFFLLAILSQIY
jgi:hypothetical protein